MRKRGRFGMDTYYRVCLGRIQDTGLVQVRKHGKFVANIEARCKLRRTLFI